MPHPAAPVLGTKAQYPEVTLDVLARFHPVHSASTQVLAAEDGVLGCSLAGEQAGSQPPSPFSAPEPPGQDGSQWV